VEEYGIDQTRLYCLGYSNGANIAVATMLLHPGTIAGGLLLRPMIVIRPDPLPDLAGAPVLISAGQHDGTVPSGGSEALGKMLSAAGAHVDIAIQNAGHDLTPADFNLGKQWFSKLH
jgi:phospholipase/carboxylesterase